MVCSIARCAVFNLQGRVVFAHVGVLAALKASLCVSAGVSGMSVLGTV